MDDSAQNPSATTPTPVASPPDTPGDTPSVPATASADGANQASSSDSFPADTPPPIIPASDSVIPAASPSGSRTGSSKEGGVPHFSDQSLGRETPQYAEADKVAKAEGDEYWEHYAREIELEKTVEDLGGIEKVESGEIKLPADVAKEMGIDPTVTVQTPMQEATGFSVGGVTLSDDQITTGLKKPTGSAFRWLAEWFMLQLVKAHYHVKRVGGKVLRGNGPGGAK